MIQKIEMRLVLVMMIFFVVLFGLASCETSVYDLGKTGNTTLARLEFENMNLVATGYPAAFNPFYAYFNRGITSYSVVRSTNQKFKIVVEPDLVWTKFTINGVKVKMETNISGYPTYTDVTGLLSADMKYTIKCMAEDGSQRDYVVEILGTNSDAAIKNILLSSGTVYPPFIEGRAPYYMDGFNGTNAYYAVADDSFAVTVQTEQPNATATINGLEAQPNVPFSITMPAGQKDGNWYDYPVIVRSQDGTMTNRKTLKLSYIQSVDDSRLVENIVLNSGAQQVSPGFYFGTTNYTAIFEDAETVVLGIKKAQAGAKVYIDTDAGTFAGPEVGAGQQSFNSAPIPVSMSGIIKIRVVSPSGAKQTEYTIKCMAFTSKPYDFSGGIKQYIDAVRIKGEYAEPMEITGVLTVKDYYGYNDAPYCYFVQDKDAGLYVFLSVGNNPNKVDSKFKLGHKITFIASKSKNYYGQMEAVEFKDMKFADGTTDPLLQKTQPLYFMPAPAFYNNSYQGKIVRYTGRVGIEINSRKVGYFENNTPFHINDPSVYAKILPRMQVGLGGTFYGPVLYGWGINQFEFVNEEYCIFGKY